MGLDATGTATGAKPSSDRGAVAFAPRSFGRAVKIRAFATDLVNDIPPGTTVVVVLFEHRWASRLKDAVVGAGGVVLAQGMVQPETLLAFGEDLAATSAAAVQPDTTQSQFPLN